MKKAQREEDARAEAHQDHGGQGLPVLAQVAFQANGHRCEPQAREGILRGEIERPALRRNVGDTELAGPADRRLHERTGDAPPTHGFSHPELVDLAPAPGHGERSPWSIVNPRQEITHWTAIALGQPGALRGTVENTAEPCSPI